VGQGATWLVWNVVFVASITDADLVCVPGSIDCLDRQNIRTAPFKLAPCIFCSTNGYNPVFTPHADETIGAAARIRTASHGLHLAGEAAWGAVATADEVLLESVPPEAVVQAGQPAPGNGQDEAWRAESM